MDIALVDVVSVLVWRALESEWVSSYVTFELYFRTFVRTFLVTLSESHPTRFRRGWTEF